MQNLAVNGYTAAAVRAALHAADRHLAFRYDLLNSTNVLQGPLDNVLAASVANNTFADIKRTATFKLRDTTDINFLSDRIRPWVRLRMPDKGWAEWPQGVFLLSTPPRKSDSYGMVTREVTAYDQLQVLLDDKTATRTTIAAGTNYITAVKAQLETAGITKYNLTPTSATLPTPRDWDPGTSRLQIINDLLGAINYKSLYFDENGTAVARPYVSPALRASEYTYQDNDQSVIFQDAEQSLDLFAIPNLWVATCSEPDRDPLTSTYTNTNADSPTSTVSRGRTIMADPISVEAADQTSLDAIVARAAYEASQVYEQATFYSGIMPMHGEHDCLTFVFSALGLSAKYTESSWSFELKAGARMTHNVRRVVSI